MILREGPPFLCIPRTDSVTGTSELEGERENILWGSEKGEYPESWGMGEAFWERPWRCEGRRCLAWVKGVGGTSGECPVYLFGRSTRA